MGESQKEKQMGRGEESIGEERKAEERRGEART